MSSEKPDATLLQWHLSLIDECLQAEHPALPNPADPAFSVEWLCLKFGLFEKAKAQVARARELGLVVCVMNRKALVRLEDFGKLFDGEAEKPET